MHWKEMVLKHGTATSMLLIVEVLLLSLLPAVPPLTTSTVSPSLALLANNLSMPPSDLPPGASPRKKPRKQQHVISTEEGDMMETNSTDDEKSTAKSLLVKAEKRKSPPKEYIGNVTSDASLLFECLYLPILLSQGKHAVILLLTKYKHTNSKYLLLCIVMFGRMTFLHTASLCTTVPTCFLSQLLSCWSPTFTCFMIVTQLFVNPFVDEEGVRYVPVRPRPPITLLRHYRNPWKAAYHHFQRYSDVRVKGQSAACTRAHGWCLRNSLGWLMLISNPTRRLCSQFGKQVLVTWANDFVS